MDMSCIVKGVILILLLMVFMVSKTSTCGPGMGVKSRPTNLYVRKRQPDVPEDSKTASGKFELALMRNDSRLKRITSTQIVFADKGYESNCRKAIKPCKDSLLRLADVVATYWSKKYKLRVMAAYKERKDLSDVYSKSSLHLEGRAFDLELIAAPGKKRLIQRSPDRLVLNLPTLAGLAYYEAEFTFVGVKQHHIHVSCSKKEKKSTGGMLLRRVFSRCFPGDAYVRRENGKILMKDVNVGDKIQTIDKQGKLIFSEVTMMMHRQINVTVTDYVKISTEDGVQITLSSHHLIPISRSNFSEEKFIFSKDVRPFQNIITYDNVKSNIRKSRVISVEHVTKAGAYAPLTLEGTIVVNDVFVSCYALFPSHTISHYVFSIWRTIYKYLPPIVSWSTNTDEYHWYPNLFRIAINMLPILPYNV